jgi:hypothetical protein
MLRLVLGGLLATGVARNRVDIDALVDLQYRDHAVRVRGEYR